jgi:pSer/pThr/pTyr-binding forkhead associated (FHA) protein
MDVLSSDWIVMFRLAGRGGEVRKVRARTVLRADGRAVITIGRAADCQLCIPRDNVSRRHAFIIVRAADDILIADSGSTNGTFVNGTKLVAPTPFGPGDRLYLGDYVVTVDGPAVRVIEGGWRVELEVVRGDGPPSTRIGELRWVSDDRHELILGRNGEVVVEGAAVGAEHCKLIINEAGGSWVADLSSPSGTFVDDEAIRDITRFPVGARLRIGDTTIRLLQRPLAPAGYVDV